MAVLDFQLQKACESTFNAANNERIHILQRGYLENKFFEKTHSPHETPEPYEYGMQFPRIQIAIPKMRNEGMA